MHHYDAQIKPQSAAQ